VVREADLDLHLLAARDTAVKAPAVVDDAAHQAMTLRLESTVGPGTVATVSFPPDRVVWQRSRAAAS